MGFKKGSVNTAIVDYIDPRDEAIDCSLDDETGELKSDIEKYKEDWDFETHCRLIPGKTPTIFKLNLNPKRKKAVDIKNASVGGDGKKKAFGFKLGDHQWEAVSCILVGIENDPDCDPEDRFNFKTDNESKVSDSLMEELNALGIIDNIYSFWISNKDNPEILKKK